MELAVAEDSLLAESKDDFKDMMKILMRETQKQASKPVTKRLNLCILVETMRAKTFYRGRTQFRERYLVTIKSSNNSKQLKFKVE